ncbi:hypothetical protein CALCODRAFT_488188, partial [Calocera cornea HHB12733]
MKIDEVLPGERERPGWMKIDEIDTNLSSIDFIMTFDRKYNALKTIHSPPGYDSIAKTEGATAQGDLVNLHPTPAQGDLVNLHPTFRDDGGATAKGDLVNLHPTPSQGDL